jgi:Mrp family chromosome partitioning ATPase
VKRNAKGKTPEDYGFHMKETDFHYHLNELSSVKKTIGVVSGKGGVGKSFVTSLLASEMERRGHRTAVLDGDITGPSQGKSFGIQRKGIRGRELIYPYVTKNGHAGHFHKYDAGKR